MLFNQIQDYGQKSDSGCAEHSHQRQRQLYLRAHLQRTQDHPEAVQGKFDQVTIEGKFNQVAIQGKFNQVAIQGKVDPSISLR